MSDATPYVRVQGGELAPIPEPLQHGRHGIACPADGCERNWPSSRHVAAYHLHWRVAHDARRTSPFPKEDTRADR